MFFKYLKYSIKTVRLYGLPFFIKCVIRRILAIARNLGAAGDSGKKIKYRSHFLNLALNDHETISRNLKVDIIIPVFNAFEYTEKCVESVLKNSSDCRLIIVDDASTDQKIKPYLEKLQNIPQKNIEILTIFNQGNLGFVKSVNLAFTKTENHFVILNSDTEVPPGWLERLFYPIIGHENDVASVTPFSNCGMICSFPEFIQDNPIFKNMDVEKLDKFFERFGSGETVEVPTGVGFCMAFNKRLTDKIGFFDAEAFGKGYGEENDWCLRAKAAGLKNVMATNLFIYHKHGASFDSLEKQQLMQENLKKILRKYPDYVFDVEQFSKNDPAADIRDSLAAIIDSHTRGDKQLSVIIDNDFIGGANVYSENLVKWLNKAEILTLQVKFNSKSQFLKFIYNGEKINKEFIFEIKGLDVFEKIILFFKPDSVLVNELVSWPDPLDIAEKIQQLNLPYILFIHDFFYLCPNWNLINQHEEFCRIPSDLTVCNKCLVENANTYNYAFYSGKYGDIEIWREKMQTFLKKAQRVICFSENSAGNLTKTYSIDNISVIEHCLVGSGLFHWQQREFKNKTLSLAVIGGIGFPKGLTILKRLIEHPEFKKLPVNIIIVGKTLLWPDGYSSKRRKITIHGEFKRDDLPSLLEKYNVNAVLLPSICPETFSFTTSEALLLGYPVICFNLGAPADRIKKYQCGIISEKVSVESLLSVIKKIIAQPDLIEELSGNTAKYHPISEQEHATEILDIIMKQS